jgi:hypothetical protein
MGKQEQQPSRPHPDTRPKRPTSNKVVHGLISKGDFHATISSNAPQIIILLDNNTKMVFNKSKIKKTVS